MIDDDDDDVQLCLVTSLFALAESGFIAVMIYSKRKIIPDGLNLREKIGHRMYDRPVYTQSTWWLMLEKGDCKVVGHAHN